MMKLVQWFIIRWPGARWRDVLDQYSRLRPLTLVLADIAQRGGVFSTHFIANEREAAFFEGKRALALEILELAKTDTHALRELIENYERTKK